jgi:hypothetical protein
MRARVGLTNEADPDVATTRDGLIASFVLLSPLLMRPPWTGCDFGTAEGTLS